MMIVAMMLHETGFSWEAGLGLQALCLLEKPLAATPRPTRSGSFTDPRLQNAGTNS